VPWPRIPDVVDGPKQAFDYNNKEQF